MKEEEFSATLKVLGWSTPSVPVQVSNKPSALIACWWLPASDRVGKIGGVVNFMDEVGAKMEPAK